MLMRVRSMLEPPRLAPWARTAGEIQALRSDKDGGIPPIFAQVASWKTLGTTLRARLSPTRAAYGEPRGGRASDTAS
jgi:hypothetical protein